MTPTSAHTGVPDTAIRCRLSVVLPLIAMVVLAAFLPSLFAELVDWDDDANLKENPYFRGFDRSRLIWMLTALYEGHYQPLTWLSYACDYAIWGELPSGELVAFGYHLTNVLIHAANTMLVFLLGLRWWGLMSARAGFFGVPEPSRNERSDEPADEDAGSLWSAGVFGLLLIVLLWAVHPLRVESVSWATERRQLLAGLFLLLATHAWTSYASAPRGGPREIRSRGLWYMAAVGLHLLSLLSSAWGITFPVLLLLWNDVPFRRWAIVGTDAPGSETRRLDRWTLARRIAETVPFFALAVLFAMIAARAQQSAAAWQSVAKLDPWQRVALMIHSSGWYPATTVWPHPLVTLRTIPPGWGLGHPAVWGAASITAVLLGIGCWRAGRGQRGWLIAVLCYLVILLPVSGVAQSGRQLVADRYSYLTTLPLFLAVGISLAKYQQGKPAADEYERTRMMRHIALPVGLLVVACTWWTQTAWWTSLSLWEKTVTWSPTNNPLAHNNYGIALARSGRTTEALEMYAIAHRLDPDDAMPLVNRGNVWFRQGDSARAILDYDAALLRKPTQFTALVNRGIALRKLREFKAAVAGLTRAIEVNPSHSFAWIERARTYGQMGLRDACLADYRRYLSLGGPRDGEVEQLLKAR